MKRPGASIDSSNKINFLRLIGGRTRAILPKIGVDKFHRARPVHAFYAYEGHNGCLFFLLVTGWAPAGSWVTQPTYRTTGPRGRRPQQGRSRVRAAKFRATPPKSLSHHLKTVTVYPANFRGKHPRNFPATCRQRGTARRTSELAGPWPLRGLRRRRELQQRRHLQRLWHS